MDRTYHTYGSAPLASGDVRHGAYCALMSSTDPPSSPGSLPPPLTGAALFLVVATLLIWHPPRASRPIVGEELVRSSPVNGLVSRQPALHEGHSESRQPAPYPPPRPPPPALQWEVIISLILFINVAGKQGRAMETEDCG